MIRKLFCLLFLSVCQTLSAADAPWFPSLSSFEHHDSGRSHVFPKARFEGNLGGSNQIDVLTSSSNFPSGYNMVYLNPKNVFIYGGGNGDVAGSIGAFVAKIDPHTLAPVWFNQLIDTTQNGEWDYPGSVAILNDGLLYVVYGYRLSEINPRTGQTIATLELPTGQGAQADTSFDGFNATADGTLVMKSVYRESGCGIQGPGALVNCPDPTDVPASVLVSVDPRRMRVIDTITLPQPVAARTTIGTVHGNTYVYLAEATTLVRYRIKKGMFTPDNAWQPGTVTLTGQTTASSYVVMDDWVVGQVNSLPAATALSVIAINQSDASRQFSIQPFLGDPIPPVVAAAFSFAAPGGAAAISWAPASVSADARNHLIYATDALPGEMAAIQLTESGLQVAWKANQTTTECTALIGPRKKRVLVGTDIPSPQIPGNNANDYAVWRNARTGEEIARAPLSPALTPGTMLQPYYFGEMFYEGQSGQLSKFTFSK
jgi:hypothetical protein